MNLKFMMFVGLTSIHIFTAQPLTPTAQQSQETPVWDFICERYALSTLKVQITKSDKGGILKLHIDATGDDYIIGGNVYVFLSNHTVITCTDKGFRKKTPTGIAASYLFSANEMQQLKTYDIQSIRFTIKGTSTKFKSQVGTFTAVNKKSYFSGFAKDEKNYYLTATEIAALK